MIDCWFQSDGYNMYIYIYIYHVFYVVKPKQNYNISLIYVIKNDVSHDKLYLTT
jgi:hypothetical protein